MYLSDFYNSGTGYYHGWLYVGHALSSGGYPGEWTISSKAYGGWKKEAWHTAYGEEYWFYDYVDEEQYVRPVFNIGGRRNRNKSIYHNK